LAVGKIGSLLVRDCIAFFKKFIELKQKQEA